MDAQIHMKRVSFQKKNSFFSGKQDFVFSNDFVLLKYVLFDRFKSENGTVGLRELGRTSNVIRTNTNSKINTFITPEIIILKMAKQG